MEELQARMSAAEFAEWMAYYSLEPWGGEYDAYERALIVSTLANVNRDVKKRKQPYKPEDFMGRFIERKPKQRPSGAELLEKVKVINRMFGGKDNADAK